MPICDILKYCSIPFKNIHHPNKVTMHCVVNKFFGGHKSTKILVKPRPPTLRSSHQRCSVKKGVLRNFTKFTGKHLCQSLFFNKVAGLRPEACNFIKKETLAQEFSCELCEISKNTFFTEHIWTTTSKHSNH